MAVIVADNACVDPRARIADGVSIGAFCVIGPDVEIGQGTRLENNVTLTGHVRIGRRNRVYQNAVLGGEPQDISYAGTDTRLEIGDDNVIREGVTIHRGSEKEEGVTRVGSHNFLMAYCHIAHDCQVGDHVVMANNSMLAGHVKVHDYAAISGGVAAHQFTTIGSYCFVSGMSMIRHDVPPYMLIEGHPAKPRCINVVGLKRNHFSPEAIHCLAEAHRLLFRARVGLDNAREILRTSNRLIPDVVHLLDFIQCQHEGSHGRSRERRKAA